MATKVNMTARINNQVRGFLNDIEEVDKWYSNAVTDEQRAGFLRYLERMAANRAAHVGLNVFEFGELVEAAQTK